MGGYTRVHTPMASPRAHKRKTSPTTKKRATKLKVFSKERVVSISLTRTTRQKPKRNTEVRIPVTYSLPIGSRVPWMYKTLSLFSIFALIGPLVVPVVAYATDPGAVGPSILISSITDSEGV